MIQLRIRPAGVTNSLNKRVIRLREDIRVPNFGKLHVKLQPHLGRGPVDRLVDVAGVGVRIGEHVRDFLRALLLRLLLSLDMLKSASKLVPLAFCRLGTLSRIQELGKGDLMLLGRWGLFLRRCFGLGLAFRLGLFLSFWRFCLGFRGLCYGLLDRNVFLVALGGGVKYLFRPSALSLRSRLAPSSSGAHVSPLLRLCEGGRVSCDGRFLLCAPF
jgi:hypothetical protein